MDELQNANFQNFAKHQHAGGAQHLDRRHGQTAGAVVTTATPGSAIDGKIVARDGSFLPAPIRDRERGFGLKHA